MRDRLALIVLTAALAIGFAAVASAQGTFMYSVASGDPRPNSVVLWTKLHEPAMPDALLLEVATDEAFTDIVASRQLASEEQYEWAVKVMVDGLEPYTTYYYRFQYGSGAAMETSPIGRTKTAPTPDMDVPVRFAVVYCQDYVDRYYNAFAQLLNHHDEDIDFVVHLGDYIYEKTSGSDSMPPQTDRAVEFQDLGGAIPLGDPNNPTYAAASLANYRTLYKTYRTDPMFQWVHERWPMMVIWDDHEFANDHWGATATDFNGLVDEYDEDRRRNAEQAFFEFVPTEIGLGDDGILDIGADMLYPNTRIYRDFPFGAQLHLVLTDGRTYRPDHLVPEDAFPGAIALDEDALIEVLTEPVFQALRSSFDPYVDMGQVGQTAGIFRQTLSLIIAGAIMREDPMADIITAYNRGRDLTAGNLSVTYINEAYRAIGLEAPYSEEDMAQMRRGVSFLFIGKRLMYTSTGVRTQVIHDTFNLYAAYLYLTSDPFGAAQEVYGGEQTAWLQGTLLQSQANWKVLGQSVMMTPLVIDFTNPAIAALLPPEFPDVFRTRLGINVEDFNGFPQKRLEIQGLLGVVPNSVVISGDIHSTFVTDHTQGVFEFTPPSVSSASLGEAVASAIASDPDLGQIPGIDELVQNLDLLLQVSSLDDENVSISDIIYTNNFAHGFMVMEAAADGLHVTIYEIDSDRISTDYYSDPDALDDLFETVEYTVQNGELIPGP